MIYSVFVFLLGLVIGLVAVAANPSPYFASLALVIVSGMACGVLIWYRGAFFSLVLFLIYLGGMLVVFAYSAALAAEPFPESWGNQGVMLNAMVHVGLLMFLYVYLGRKWQEPYLLSVNDPGEFYVFQGDIGGVALMYSSWGGMLMISAYVLLLTLFVVLELTRGLSRGAVRAV
uniref:NADH-ubiquinone oxidoreductase chain 6 n=3 Tax=Pampus TaxID=163125 RepID=A0A023J7W2_PAMAR|nr:NADH dehydrogenase subunit 6 [Pampus sp. LY-2009]YP_008994373.1 NADH dehydrogenase subunit 6 [Pampus echinogaster]YP_009002371.1 NADH dehydrogenase subunit 6 [Pampus argenteus]ABY51660.1 NADH dehydrogenase subunit 6 [Pampus sp. LY-2009]AGT54904.1 NADH dehydrogenase subunit 6 [Pampus echinogaster]AHH24439.1 NADH dehydrogenase subunit 6 [Pampus argenteus]WAJ58220.1 NADH dehydrogenase subunit 6 [Pampus argenteus]WAJ58233.1 NADH dehydrogenase subunit 6 [Pampus argenteus]